MVWRLGGFCFSVGMLKFASWFFGICFWDFFVIVTAVLGSVVLWGVLFFCVSIGRFIFLLTVSSSLLFIGHLYVCFYLFWRVFQICGIVRADFWFWVCRVGEFLGCVGGVVCFVCFVREVMKGATVLGFGVICFLFNLCGVFALV